MPLTDIAAAQEKQRMLEQAEIVRLKAALKQCEHLAALIALDHPMGEDIQRIAQKALRENE